MNGRWKWVEGILFGFLFGALAYFAAFACGNDESSNNGYNNVNSGTVPGCTIGDDCRSNSDCDGGTCTAECICNNGWVNCGSGTILVDGQCVPTNNANNTTNNATNNGANNTTNNITNNGTNNGTNNATNNATNNGVNNGTNNATNNATNNGTNGRVKGAYRLWVGTTATRGTSASPADDGWVLVGEAEGIAALLVPDLPPIMGVYRYALIEDISPVGESAKIDSVALFKKGLDQLSFAEYPGESNVADELGAVSTPNSNCLNPILAPYSMPRVTDLGGEAGGGYVTVELFDFVQKDDEFFVFEVGDCSPIHEIADPTDDFFTESDAAPTLTLAQTDLIGHEVRVQYFDAAELDVLSRSIWKCEDSIYANFNCAPDASPLAAGWTMIATARYADFVRSVDVNNSTRYVLAFQSDNTITNDKPADAVLDPFQGADKWFQFYWDHDSSNWVFESAKYTGQIVAFTTSTVRARAWGVGTVFVASIEEFDAKPRYRFFTYATDSSGNEGGDVNGQKPTEPFLEIQ